MNYELINNLIESGLVQFGLFGDADPIRISLHLLPSYPRILDAVVRAMSAEFDLEIARLDYFIATIESLPIATALSLLTNKPLVYSRGRGEAPTHDLVGAYDVGHPAALIVDSWREETAPLIEGAQRVGLDIVRTVAVIDNGNRPDDEHIRFRSVINLRDVMMHLSREGRLPQPQAQAVLDWIIRHPG